MTATLWLDTPTEKTIEFGATLPFYQAFAEMAHVVGPNYLTVYPALFGVVTQCELQTDADKTWLADAKVQASALLVAAGSRLSPNARGVLQSLIQG